MSLEDQIKQLEDKFPEMKDRLKKYIDNSDNSYCEGEVKEVKYRETEQHQLAITKWQEEERITGMEPRIHRYCVIYRKEKGRADAQIEEIPMLQQIAMKE